MIVHGLVPTVASAILADVDAGRVDMPMFQAFTARIIKASPLDIADVNDTAALIARESAGRLIVGIGKDAAESVRKIVQRAFINGWDDYTLAERLKTVVGLDPHRVAVADAFYDNLIKNGIPKGVARRQQRQKINEMRFQRALLIATTEIRWCLSEAQRRMWMEMVERGELPSSATRRWVSRLDKSVCAQCKALHGTTAGLDSPYSDGVMTPPCHPRCRCTEVVDAKELL